MAAKNLSVEFKISIRKLETKGMRDKLIHGYFGVDLGAVWDTATRDIPSLREKLREILKIEEKG